MQITKESLKLCSEDMKMWKLMFIRLDYLRMNFLLERLSAERGGESRQKLVDVAREILDSYGLSETVPDIVTTIMITLQVDNHLAPCVCRNA
jgi:hypothetical protein